MTAIEVLSMAKAEGLALILNGDRLSWRADHLPPDGLLLEVKAHRLEIIGDLKQRQTDWLAAVARLLGCSPDHLMAHDFIDQYDLAEQCDTHPAYAASLIRSHPAWLPAKEPECPVFEPYDELVYVRAISDKSLRAFAADLHDRQPGGRQWRTPPPVE